jgi:hypothetical protein
MHEATIKSIGRVEYQEKPFDEAYQNIVKRSGKLITARDLAYARIEKGKNNHLSTNGSYVREGSLFVPKSNHKRYWLRDSLVLQNAAEAASQHRKNEEFFLKDDFQAEKFLKNLSSGDYLILDDLSPIAAGNFANDTRAKWLFKDVAEKYGAFLQNAGVNKIDIFMNNDNNYIDSKDKCFVNQLWVHGVGDDSDVSGDGGLYVSDTVRGVFSIKGAAGGDAKIHLLYNSKQINGIKTALHKQGISGDLEKRILISLPK